MKMRTHYARLDENKKVVAVEFLNDMEEIFEDPEKHRRVGFDKIGDVEVSTVFLGINHGFREKDLWFETMVFGGPHDGEQWRCETWDEAVTQHKLAVKLVKRCFEDEK